jgi:hypothetical protein
MAIWQVRQLVSVLAMGAVGAGLLAACGTTTVSAAGHPRGPSDGVRTRVPAAASSGTAGAPPATGTTSVGRSSSAGGAALADFPTPVRQALGWLRTRTTLPLAGPMTLDARVPLSATASVQAHGYSVDLYACQPPEPLNDPSMTASCGAAVDDVGSFGVTAEPSAAAALASLPGMVSMAGASQPLAACPAGSPTTVVDDQRIATCGSISGTSDPSTASWTEGDWTIVTQLSGFGEPWTDQVQPLVQRVHQVVLPQYEGWIGVDEGGDGEHTTVAWAEGDDVFSVFDYHSAVGAVDLASSERVVS